jgi:hypothetical protein
MGHSLESQKKMPLNREYRIKLTILLKNNNSFVSHHASRRLQPEFPPKLSFPQISQRRFSPAIHSETG